MRAWLYTVARNLYFNYSKKEKRKDDYDEISELATDGTEVIEKIIKIEEYRLLYKAMQSIDRQK